LVREFLEELFVQVLETLTDIIRFVSRKEILPFDVVTGSHGKVSDRTPKEPIKREVWARSLALRESVTKLVACIRNVKKGLVRIVRMSRSV